MALLVHDEQVKGREEQGKKHAGDIYLGSPLLRPYIHAERDNRECENNLGVDLQLFVFIETESCCVAQASLKLSILLPQSIGSWDYMYVIPTHLS